MIWANFLPVEALRSGNFYGLGEIHSLIAIFSVGSISIFLLINAMFKINLINKTSLFIVCLLFYIFFIFYGVPWAGIKQAQLTALASDWREDETIAEISPKGFPKASAGWVERSETHRHNFQ
ncbi:MAG: hypothetical protein LBE24_06640 [Methylobacillus sp.]|nr:hypothetical protein [Methylobacillus sp.]